MVFSDIVRPVPTDQGEFDRPPGTLEVAAIRGLQGVTVEAVHSAAAAEIGRVTQAARSGFLEGLKQSVFAPLSGIFAGKPDGGLPDISTAVTEQQSRTQSLWDERGRGHVFSSKNLTYSGDQTAGTRLRIPFTEQVGPLIGVDIDPEGGLILKTPGSWMVTTKVGVSGTSALGGDWQRVWVEARRADGSLLAESWATGWAAKDQATVMDILPLVISPYEASDGVTVRIFQDCGRWRYLLGGHGYTFLYAQKQSSTRVMSSVNPGDPGIFELKETGA